MALKKKFLYFCFAGASGALVELISFNIFFLFLNFNYSKVLSLFFALSLNFVMNRNITFVARKGKITKQFIKYLLIYIVAILVNINSSIFIESLLPKGIIYANLSTVSGIILALPITFFGSLHWVFKDKIKA